MQPRTHQKEVAVKKAEQWMSHVKIQGQPHTMQFVSHVLSVQSPKMLTFWPANFSNCCCTHIPTVTNFIFAWNLALYIPRRETGRGGGTSLNHQGDRDSAFESSDPLWENSVWPPWPSGCGVCVRAGNHCMMTMPYVIRHKLTFCLRRSTVCLCTRAPDTEEGFHGHGDECLDERPSLLPWLVFEIVKRWFSSVVCPGDSGCLGSFSYEYMLSFIGYQKKAAAFSHCRSCNPSSIIVRTLRNFTGIVCFSKVSLYLWGQVWSQSVDIGLDLSLQWPQPVGSPLVGHLWRLRNLNVCHKTQPFMCDQTIVPSHTKSSLCCVWLLLSVDVAMSNTSY